MDKNLFASRYASLRPYVNRYARKLGRLLYYAVPEMLVIAAAVWILLSLIEHFFFL